MIAVRFARSFQGWLVIMLFSVLLGCASPPAATEDYDPSEGITTYESQPVSLSGLRIGSSSLSNENTVSVQALGQCRGADCRPDGVVLIFRASGSNDLRLNNPSVELTAGKLTVTSVSPDGDAKLNVQNIPQVAGEIIRVGLSFQNFQRLAEAKELSGSFAGSRFTLSQSRTQPFRRLIRKASGSEE